VRDREKDIHSFVFAGELVAVANVNIANWTG